MSRDERSRQARFLERLARRIFIPKGQNMTEVMLELKKFRGKERNYSLPILAKMMDSFETDRFHDVQTFYINKDSKQDYTIMYLHGGAYVSEMNIFHWVLLDKIARSLECLMLIPDYPLAPLHTYEESYDKLTKMYIEYITRFPDQKIILMGDSAGGGLALGLAEYFGQKGIRQPDKLILLSPWVDLNMDNRDIDRYIDVDPTLKRNELLADAIYWANRTSLHDYRLSPIYGDVSMLKEVHLFVGTHEIFYPDVMKMYEKLLENGVKATVTVGEGLNHVYPAYPIPEADEAIRHMIELIKNG